MFANDRADNTSREFRSRFDAMTGEQNCFKVFANDRAKNTSREFHSNFDAVTGRTYSSHQSI